MRAIVRLCLICLLSMPPSVLAQEQAAQPVDPAAVQAAGKILQGEAQKLLMEIASLRAQTLEKMQSDVLKDVQAWEDETLEMDGQALKTLLAEAYRVAEARNLPVARLQAMFELAKAALLRADYASLCGGGQDIGDAVVEVAKKVREVTRGEDAEYFFSLAKRVEGRMECEQKHRVEAFKGSYRHFLRALTAETPEEAEKQIKDFAAVVRSMNEAEGNALMADAEVLSAQLGQADMILKMVPVVDKAFDMWDLYSGETVGGEKLTTLDKGLTWVGLLYPEAFGMALGYAAKGIGKGVSMAAGGMTKSVAFLWKLATSNNTTLAGIGKATGRNMDLLKNQAVDMLQWLKGANAELVAKAGDMAGSSAVKIASLGESLKGKLSSDSVMFDAVDEVVAATGRPAEWVKGFTKVAQESNTIVITRSFNSEASDLYRAGKATPKPIFVKSKSSHYKELGGTIPVDGSLSKVASEAKFKELQKNIEADLLAKGKSQAEAQAESIRKARQLQDADIAKANGEAAECIRKGLCEPMTFVNTKGNTVMQAFASNGKMRLLEQTPDGKLLDGSTGAVVDPSSVKSMKPVEVLGEPHSKQYFGPDEDILGMGHRSGKSRQMVEGHHTSGTFDQRNKNIMFQANIAVRQELKAAGKEGYQVSSHGSAQFFDADIETKGFMAYMPDGKAFLINSKKDLKAVFEYAKTMGYEGLDWNPAWGTP